MNRLIHDCTNPNQGEFVKALCICSAGLLRSPTLAWILSNRGFNTRAAGVHDYALVEVDEVLVRWADRFFCVEPQITDVLRSKFSIDASEITTLHIPDQFEFRDPELVKRIEQELDNLGIR